MQGLQVEVIMDERRHSFVAQMPVIAFQRCLYLLFEAICFKLAAADRDLVVLNIQVLDQSHEVQPIQLATPCRYVLRSKAWITMVTF